MRIKLAPKLAAVAVASVALATVGAAIAAGEGDHDHGEVSEAAKYRHTVMEAMGSHFAAVAVIFTGRVNKPDDLLVHAKALAETTALAGGLFEEGSEGGAALPIIWEEPDKVQAASKKSAEATAALAAAIEGGDKKQIAAAFKEAGGACKGCHERYKEEED